MRWICVKGNFGGETMIDMNDVAEIMNMINETVEPIGYLATGFDNTNEFLTVMIEKSGENE